MVKDPQQWLAELESFVAGHGRLPRHRFGGFAEQSLKQWIVRVRRGQPVPRKVRARVEEIVEQYPTAVGVPVAPRRGRHPEEACAERQMQELAAAHLCQLQAAVAAAVARGRREAAAKMRELLTAELKGVPGNIPRGTMMTYVGGLARARRLAEGLYVQARDAESRVADDGL